MKHLLFFILLLPLVSNANSEEVILKTSLGPLVGTLQLPKNKDSKAVALIITGSGNVDRDGNIKGLDGKNNGIKMLAESLSARGIASLRFDKRLVGQSAKSTLTESELRFTHYIDDAERWLVFLNNKFDEALFVIGHSEGSLIGMVAANRTPVDGLISIAGAGRPASQILREQLKNRLPSTLMKESESLIKSLEIGKAVKGPPELSAIFRPSVQPYLISWFKYNPAQQIGQLNVPVQIVHGTTDIQVPIDDAKLLHRHAPDSQLVILDGMNHVLKPVSGNLQEQIFSYSEPSLNLAPKLVPAIADFILNEALLPIDTY